MHVLVAMVIVPDSCELIQGDRELTASNVTLVQVYVSPTMHNAAQCAEDDCCVPGFWGAGDKSCNQKLYAEGPLCGDCNLMLWLSKHPCGIVFRPALTRGGQKAQT